MLFIIRHDFAYYIMCYMGEVSICVNFEFVPFVLDHTCDGSGSRNKFPYLMYFKAS